MKDEARRRRPRARLALVAFTLAFIVRPLSLLAQPTQDEVLRGISRGMDQQSGDPSKMLALLAAAAGLAVLLVVLGYRRQREVAPKALNHHGKLLKELSKALSLKPAEVRQLKLLAEGQDLASPLTLLLCPKMLARAAQEHPGRVDHNAVASIARKLERRA
jgi:hypothetical protein